MATPLWGREASLVRRERRVSSTVPPTSGSSTSSAASSAAQKGLQPFSFIAYFPSIKKLHKAWSAGGTFMQKRREML